MDTMTKETYRQDLTFLQAALPELQSYMLSKEVFWPLMSSSAFKDMSMLTLGMLELVVRRLQSLSLNVAADMEVEKAVAEYLAFKEKWQSNVAAKLATEYGVRQRLWQAYLSDTVNSEDRIATEYAYKVRWRAILTLIEAAAAVNPAELDLTRQLDKALNSMTLPAEFVWDKAFETGFPEKSFWYLYRKMRGAN